MAMMIFVAAGCGLPRFLKQDLKLVNVHQARLKYIIYMPPTGSKEQLEHLKRGIAAHIFASSSRQLSAWQLLGCETPETKEPWDSSRAPRTTNGNPKKANGTRALPTGACTRQENLHSCIHAAIASSQLLQFDRRMEANRHQSPCTHTTTHRCACRRAASKEREATHPLDKLPRYAKPPFLHA